MSQTPFPHTMKNDFHFHFPCPPRRQGGAAGASHPCVTCFTMCVLCACMWRHSKWQLALVVGRSISYHLISILHPECDGGGRLGGCVSVMPSSFALPNPFCWAGISTSYFLVSPSWPCLVAFLYFLSHPLQSPPPSPLHLLISCVFIRFWIYSFKSRPKSMPHLHLPHGSSWYDGSMCGNVIICHLSQDRMMGREALKASLTPWTSSACLCFLHKTTTPLACFPSSSSSAWGQFFFLHCV